MSGLHGNKIYSKAFKVLRKGVIQGDIISPIFFILAMEQIFRIHDPSPEGVSVGNYLQIGVLGYADDAALLSTDITALTKRLTYIERGSRENAEMKVHPGKTKTMHVEEQAALPIPTHEQVQATEKGYTHECEF